MGQLIEMEVCSPIFDDWYPRGEVGGCWDAIFEKKLVWDGRFHSTR